MFFKKLIPSLLWALFILSLCALPGSAIPELTFLDWLKPDKIVHLVLFGVLSFLLVKAFLDPNAGKTLSNWARSLSLVLSSLYGVLMELLQEYFFTSRRGDVYDALADAFGAILGLWFFKTWKRRKIA